MAQSSHALKQVMTLCCGERGWEMLALCLYPFIFTFTEPPFYNWKSWLPWTVLLVVWLVCSCELCEGLQISGLALFQSWEYRQTVRRRWHKLDKLRKDEIRRKSRTIYDNMMHRLLWHRSCAGRPTRDTTWRPVGTRKSQTRRMWNPWQHHGRT